MIKTIKYTKSLETKALKAIAEYKKDKKAGNIKKLEGRLSDLLD